MGTTATKDLPLSTIQKAIVEIEEEIRYCRISRTNLLIEEMRMEVELKQFLRERDKLIKLSTI